MEVKCLWIRWDGWGKEERVVVFGSNLIVYRKTKRHSIVRDIVQEESIISSQMTPGGKWERGYHSKSQDCLAAAQDGQLRIHSFFL